MQPHPSTPPGWYPDPLGPGQRWWDGNSWTPGTRAFPPADGSNTKSIRRPHVWILAALVIVAIILGTVAVVVSSSKDGSSSNSANESAESSEITGTLEDWTAAVCHPSGTMYFPGRADSKGFVSMKNADSGDSCVADVGNAYISIGHYRSVTDAQADLDCNMFGAYVQAITSDGQLNMIASSSGVQTLRALEQFGFEIYPHTTEKTSEILNSACFR